MRTLCQIGALLVVIALCAVSQSRAQSPILVPASTTNVPGLWNLVVNGSFEEGGSGWNPYGSGFSISAGQSQAGLRSLASNAPDSGAYQIITIRQTLATPILFSAASRANQVTGQADSDYALWLDLQYTDGSWTFGVFQPFATGSHGWQTVYGSFVPQKPLALVNVYLLFRGNHQGQAWFDQVFVADAGDIVGVFDGLPVLRPTFSTAAGCGAAAGAGLETADGLTVAFASGGTVSKVEASGAALTNCSSAGLSGFLARDVAANGAVVAFHPAVTASGSAVSLDQSGEQEPFQDFADPPLNLALHAIIAAQADRLEIEATIRNLAPAQDRAVTLYFALPLEAEHWSWWDDLRTARAITGPGEFRNTVPVGWGANGAYSPHMLASLTGPTGVALAYPMDSPAALRLAYNNDLKIFYIAFDLALTPETSNFRNQATVRFIVYQHPPAWGLRSAFAKYMAVYPQFFVKRSPKEGIWVAFDSLSSIPHPEDFGIQFHEVSGLSDLPFDQTLGVSAFPYLSEPWSFWMGMPPQIDTLDYQSVVGFLASEASSAVDTTRSQAAAAALSGVYVRGDHLLFWPQPRPWMPRGAVIVTNPNPNISALSGTLPGAAASSTVQTPSKGQLDWNSSVQQIYRDPAIAGALAGGYVDSLEATGALLDYRRSHFGASSLPLTFSRDEPRVPGVPQIFSTYEFVRRVSDDLHSQYGKLSMANQTLSQFAFYAHTLDVLGAEINWAPGSQWAPDGDASLLFRRMYAGSKPVLLLMNTDFSKLTGPMMDQYFQTALFYGIYPSLFSADAMTHTYWSNPALYERDRPLFRRYVPWIRALSARGWQPVTAARSSNSQVLVERYGSGDGTVFALRNTGDAMTTFTLQVDPVLAGLSNRVQYTVIEWIGQNRQIVQSGSSWLSFSGAIAPGQTQCWQLERAAP